MTSNYAMSTKYEHTLCEVPATMGPEKIQAMLGQVEDEAFELVAVVQIPWTRPPCTRHYFKREKSLIMQAPNMRDVAARQMEG